MIVRTEFSNDDIQSAMDNNASGLFNYSDIEGLIAEIPGHNDEDDWFWIGKLKDGRFFGARGGCDYTGWDCQSHCDYWVGKSITEIIAGFEKEATFEQIAQLRAQVDELQPFGMGVTIRPED